MKSLSLPCNNGYGYKKEKLLFNFKERDFHLCNHFLVKYNFLHFNTSKIKFKTNFVCVHLKVTLADINYLKYY